MSEKLRDSEFEVLRKYLVWYIKQDISIGAFVEMVNWVYKFYCRPKA